METFFIELEITGQLAMDQQQHLQRRMRVRQYILPLGVPLEPVVANQPYAVDYGALADPVDQWDNPQMGWRLLEHRLMEMEDFNDRLDNYVWWQRLLERLEPGNHLIGEGGVVLPVGQHNRQFALLVKRIYTVRLIDARTQFNYYLMLITRTFVRCANTLDSEMNDNSTEGLQLANQILDNLEAIGRNLLLAGLISFQVQNLQVLGCTVNNGRILELIMHWPEPDDPRDHEPMDEVEEYVAVEVPFDDPDVAEHTADGPHYFQF